MQKKTIQKTELQRILKALDFMNRIYIGQYEHLVEINKPFYSFHFPEDRDLVNHLMKIRSQFIPHLKGCSYNASLGIWSPMTPLIAIRSYDILQVLRYQNAYHNNPEGDLTVNFNTPFIHGEWHMETIDRDLIAQIVKENQYKDYLYGIERIWYCPVVITRFDKNTISYYCSPEVQDIINKALHVYELCRDYKFLEVFECLYPRYDSSTLKDDVTEVVRMVKELEDFR